MDDHGSPKGGMIEKMVVNEDTGVIVEERKSVSKERENVQSADTPASAVQDSVLRKSKVTFRAPDRVTSEPKVRPVETEGDTVETPVLFRETTEPAANREASVVLRETERASTEIRMSLGVTESLLYRSVEAPEHSKGTEIRDNGASLILIQTKIATKETNVRFREAEHNPEDSVLLGETERTTGNDPELFRDTERATMDTSVPFRKMERATVDASVPFRKTERATMDALVPFRKTERATVDASVPFRKTERAAVDTSVPFRNTERATVDTSVPFRKTERATVDASVPFRKTERATVDATVPFRKTERATVDAPVHFREKEIATVDTAEPFKETEKANMDAPILFIDTQRANMDSSVFFRETGRATVDAPVVFIDSRRVTVDSAVNARHFSPRHAVSVITEVGPRLSTAYQQVAKAFQRLSAAARGAATVSQPPPFCSTSEAAAQVSRASRSVDIALENLENASSELDIVSLMPSDIRHHPRDSAQTAALSPSPTGRQTSIPISRHSIARALCPCSLL
jgi:hypothetical protein